MTPTAEQTLLEEGIHHNVPFDVYAADPGLNFSKLKHMSVSPKHFEYELNAPDQDTPAMLLGRAIHHAILEPEIFESDYAKYPKEQYLRDYGGPNRSWSTKAYKENKAEWYLANADKFVLDDDQHHKAQAMAAAVHEHEVASELLDATGMNELSVIRMLGKHRTKARIDRLIDWDGYQRLIDIKSISAKQKDFHHKICNDEIMYRKYYLQMAWYIRVLQPEKITLPTWIFVQSEAPHDVVVILMDEMTLDACINEVNILFDRWKVCKASDEWPGVADIEIPVSLPDFLFQPQQ